MRLNNKKKHSTRKIKNNKTEDNKYTKNNKNIKYNKYENTRGAKKSEMNRFFFFPSLRYPVNPPNQYGSS